MTLLFTRWIKIFKYAMAYMAHPLGTPLLAIWAWTLVSTVRTDPKKKFFLSDFSPPPVWIDLVSAYATIIAWQFIICVCKKKYIPNKTHVMKAPIMSLNGKIMNRIFVNVYVKDSKSREVKASRQAAASKPLEAKSWRAFHSYQSWKRTCCSAASPAIVHG